MSGGPQKPPAGRVGPEPLQQFARRGPGGNGADLGEGCGRCPVRVDGDAEADPVRVGRLFAGGPAPGALGDEEPEHGLGGDGGADLPRVVELVDLVPERVPVPVPEALFPYGGEHGPVAGGGGVEGEAQEPGPGDLDPPHAGLGGDAFTQDAGDLQGGQRGGPGELEGDGAGVVAAAAGPGPLHSHARGHGYAQRILVDRAAHGVQHGPGEVGGGHGSSVGERGGHFATRFRHPVSRARFHGAWQPAPARHAGQPAVLPARPAPRRPSAEGSSSPVTSRRMIRTSSLGSNGFARNASTPAATPASTS